VFGVLYLNPPYDTLPGGARLEALFLDRFLPTLVEGGILLAVLPASALVGCAASLATHCGEALALRFPEPQWDAFGQVVVLARARKRGDLVPVAERHRYREALAWAADPAGLPVLGTATVAPWLAPPAPGPRHGRWVVAPLDVTGVRGLLRPGWRGRAAAPGTPSRGLALDHDSVDLGTPPVRTATTLTPAHILLALAAGYYDGTPLPPDEPGPGWPTVLLRARFDRVIAAGEPEVQAGGDLVVSGFEEPQLRVVALDLDAGIYREIAPGDAPSAATTLAEANTVDVVVRYRAGLLRQMIAQTRPKYDPGKLAHRFPLPPVGMRPFRIQADAIRTALVQLAMGEHVLVPGEVGTGKTLVSLATVEALSRRNFARTRQSLDVLDQPLSARQRPLETVLVLMPTHLITTWAEAITTILPGAVALPLDTIGQLRRLPVPRVAEDGRPGAGLRFLLLSKETAKLGYEIVGATGLGPRDRAPHTPYVCPTCGNPVALDPARLVGRRARCDARPLLPTPLRRGLLALIGTLAGACAEQEQVATLLAGRFARMRWERILDRAAGDDTRTPAARWAALGRATVAAEEATDALLRGTLGLVGWAGLRALLTAGAAMQEGAVSDEALPILLVGALAGQPVRAVGSVAHTAYAAALGALCPLLLGGDEGVGVLRQQFAAFVTALPLTLPGRDALACDLALALDRVASAAPSNDHAAGTLVSLAQCLLYQVGDVALRDATHAAFRSDRSHTRADWQQKAPGAARRIAEALGVARGALPAPPTPAHRDFRDAIVCRGGGVYQVGGVTLGDLDGLRSALAQILEAVPFPRGEACAAPLYSASPRLHRVSLAKYIARYHPGLIDAIIADEAQQYRTKGTAQTFAYHRLAQGKPILCLSGSISSGRSSSVFENLWLLAPPGFRERYGREDTAEFVRDYGYRKIRLRVAAGDAGRTGDPPGAISYGSFSDLQASAQSVTIDEAPGLDPRALLGYILPIAAPMRKAALDIALPPKTERSVPVAADPASAQDQLLLREFARLQMAIAAQIAADAFTSDQGAMLGALGSLESYPDRCTVDTGNGGEAGVWEIRTPPGHTRPRTLVATGHLFPADYRTPKERWLLATVRAQVAAGRNVIVGLRHTGGDKRLPLRLQRLLGAIVGKGGVAFLDAEVVSAKKRKEWIDTMVLARGVRVLLVNPASVETGLNNLVAFATLILIQNPQADAIVYRQAFGRIDRPGQTRPTELLVPFLEGTIQRVGVALLARKVAASLEADGIDIGSTLGAVGGGQRAAGTRTGGSFGALLLQALEQGLAGTGEVALGRENATLSAETSGAEETSGWLWAGLDGLSPLPFLPPLPAEVTLGQRLE